MEPTRPKLIKRRHPLPPILQPIPKQPEPPEPPETSLFYDRFLHSIEKAIEREEKKVLKWGASSIEAFREEHEDDYGDANDLYRDGYQEQKKELEDQEKEIIDDITFKARQVTVKQAVKEVRAVLDEVDHLHYEELHGRRRKKWRLQKGIQEAHVRDEVGEWKSVSKRLDKTEFGPFYRYLYNNRYQKWHEKTQDLIEQAGGKHWKGDHGVNTKDIQEMVVQTFDREKMSKELNLSESSIAKYLGMFADYELLKRLPKRVGRGGKWVYSMGYWQPYYDKKDIPHWGKSRPIYYLQVNPWTIENLFKMRL